jgi:SRSO17 transposase
MRKQSIESEPSLFPLDASPIHGAVSTLPPIDLKIASRSQLEPLWDDLVRRHHYLGYQRLLGHRLKYLAFVQDRPVAALSFSAPALKLRVRDHYIGWTAPQREAHLDRIVSNSRFLILPWVKVPNLASHVLAKALARLSRDWEDRFNTRLWLVETFIDPSRYKGTCYKAANWRFIGETYGSGKQGNGYVYHGVVKEVYVYVIEPRFRNLIGCKQQPYSLFHRPSLSQQNVEDLQMILRHADWNPDIVPGVKLTEADLASLAGELVSFHQQFHEAYGRMEHRRLGLAYLSGLLSDKEEKSVEPIALAFLGEKNVRSLQMFMKTYRWDHEAMEATNLTMLSAAISGPTGMLTVDSSENLKKGKESVGVAHQYCGRYGKTDNCQSGVFVGYTSPKGYGLLTSRLYMPRSWFTEEYKDRRKFNLVPEELVFQTKPEIAAELINKIEKTNLFPATWVGCDATFGSDWAFLESLPPDKYYFASIKSNTQVFTMKPKTGVPRYTGHGRRPTRLRVLRGAPKTVATLAHSKKCVWTKVVLAEGAKGPILAEVARLRVIPSLDGLPYKTPLWLFMRRMEDGQIKFAFSNAPESMPLSGLCEAAIMRWPIEQCFQDGKSQVGMDKYEHRSWPAWHRHMAYVFLALHFLLRLRLQFKKNTGINSPASSASDGGYLAPEGIDARACARSFDISYEAESCRVSLPSKETTGIA